MLSTIFAFVLTFTFLSCNKEIVVEDLYTAKKEQEDHICTCILKSINENTIQFGVVTDTHINDSDMMVEHGKLFNQLCHKFGMNFGIHLGDVFDNTGTSEGDIKRMMKYWNTMYDNTIPIMYCQGNHEMFQDKALTQAQIIEITQGTRKFFSGLENSYYYFDIKNCRFIVCNTSDGNNGFSAKQLEWIKKTFGSLNGKKALVFMHIPYDGALGITGTPYNGMNVASILEEHSNDIIAVIHGHTHYDNVVRLHNLNNISVCCDAPRDITSHIGEGKEFPEPIVRNWIAYPRKIGTLSEYCMDFVVVNTENRSVKMFRFGCGTDRLITN